MDGSTYFKPEGSRRFTWTPDMVARLREIWADTSRSLESTIPSIGVSEMTARRKARELGLHRTRRRTLKDMGTPILPDVWTPEMIADLKKHWDSGRSCAEIAKAMNISKNAVIGKVRRLDLTRRREKPKAELFGGHITKITLEMWPKAGECAFPIGDPCEEHFSFCKEPVAPDSVNYCSHHRRICYVAKVKAA